jgi:hypothetical protein
LTYSPGSHTVGMSRRGGSGVPALHGAFREVTHGHPGGRTLLQEVDVTDTAHPKDRLFAFLWMLMPARKARAVAAWIRHWLTHSS